MPAYDPEDERINNKHYRIRGSHDLKYPPNASRCRNTCGLDHDWITDVNGREHPREHRCFLAVGHKELYCEFSSACGAERVKRLPDLHQDVLADDGFEILKTVA